MVKLVFFAVGCVMVGIFFRQNRVEYSFLIGLTCSLLLLFFGLDKLGEIFHRMEELSLYMGEMKEFFPLLLKVFGICARTQGTNRCRPRLRFWVRFPLCWPECRWCLP